MARAGHFAFLMVAVACLAPVKALAQGRDHQRYCWPGSGRNQRCRGWRHCDDHKLGDRTESTHEPKRP